MLFIIGIVLRSVICIICEIEMKIRNFFLMKFEMFKNWISLCEIVLLNMSVRWILNDVL